MGDIRAKFSLPIDEDFILADYPTLDHMMGYIVKMQGGEVAPKPAAVEPTAPMPSVSPAPVVDSPTAESSHHRTYSRGRLEINLQWLASS